MDEQQSAEIVEVVARFESSEAFKAALEALLAAGFERSDLSLLDTHESIDAAGEEGTAWQDTLAGLVGEVNYVGPLTAAGLIAIAAGPVGAMIAATVAAGITGLALREVLEQAQATPHTEAFARALQHGALLLWVYAPDEARQTRAKAILSTNGGKDVHIHSRNTISA